MARALVQELKSQRDPRSIIAQARRIPDPGHAAWAILRASDDPRLSFQEASDALSEAIDLIAGIERLSRRAELWSDVLRRAPKWRSKARNPRAAPTRAQAIEAAIADLEAMPDGQWVLDAIVDVAGAVGAAARVRLLKRAAKNEGFEVPGCRAIVRAAPEQEQAALRDVIETFPTTLKAHLLGRVDPDDAVTAAWAIADRNARLEALRVLVWRAEDESALQAIVASAESAVMEDRARVLTTAAARADKLGMTTKWFDDARQAVAAIADESIRTKEARKLATAAERADIQMDLPLPTSDDAKPSVGRVENLIQKPTSAPVTQHTLALVNGYEGGLGPSHVRAIARAAPLCDAFGIHLLLVDFPVSDTKTLGDIVAAETRIGEADHVRTLVTAGRLTLRRWSDDAPWPGTLVATTPRPDPEKAHELSGPTCLLMGLGHHGLPRRILDAVDRHYEITGRQVSLETATAMGILAERLRSAPA